MLARFSRQVALVTGGADGIGKAVAQRLAAEGASLVLFDTHDERLQQCAAELSERGVRVLALNVDISDDYAVAQGIARAMDEFSRLDVVVHCAGIVGPNGRKLTEISVEDFDRVQAVNVRGSFSIVKHAVNAMLPRNYGRILLFASISGKEGNAGMGPYSVSKAAVIGLVKVAGKEFAGTGITINGIAPAVIQTAMVASMVPEQVKYMTDKIPMQRCGTLEEVAALSCWIVSSEASFNTAAIFDLSGGRATY